MMIKVGFVGWRGMVGSVLLTRMERESDFDGSFVPSFFSTSVSQAFAEKPAFVSGIEDANDLVKLATMDILVVCQGSEYTRNTYFKLREKGWLGYWVDAASELRLAEDSVLALGPINQELIDKGLSSGIKNYIGANCTVSLMLMAVGHLIKSNLVESINVATYQAYSGAGSKILREFVNQIHKLGVATAPFLNNADTNILALEKQVNEIIYSEDFSGHDEKVPLVANLFPWIDYAMPNGQTKEEWKVSAETKKILGLKEIIPIDGICVRVGSLRCHSQALTVKLKQNLEIEEIHHLITQSTLWTKIVPNQQKETLHHLTPVAVSGSLDIVVGRIRKSLLGPEYLSLFTVGDQLLWGAAEPIRLVLKSILKYITLCRENIHGLA